MYESRTRYPGYDLLKEKEHWDEHTREIVCKRLGPFLPFKFLQKKEAEEILSLARHIVYDERREILDYIIHELDEKLGLPFGEDQRKLGTPDGKMLIRQGLKLLNDSARDQYDRSFSGLDKTLQVTMLRNLQQGIALPPTIWGEFPQKEFFKKLVRELVSAYYSLPAAPAPTMQISASLPYFLCLR